MNGNPTVISLFAGCGGSSLGYKMAGFEELLAVEWDKKIVETFKLNFPDVPIWERNIKTIDGSEILKFCETKKRELDVLDGSPPCQGFSTAGKRRINDKRNDLFRENIRLIGETSPKIFVIENTKGMAIGKMRGLFNEYMSMLKALPYLVRCRLLNAKYYNVPQSRQRLIWMGVRKDLGVIPTYPKPNRKLISIGEALEGCSGAKKHRPAKGAMILCRLLRRKCYGRNITGHSYFNLIRNKWSTPSNTIIRTMRASQSGLLHSIEDRFYTIEELKRLQTFPDGFKLAGIFEEQWGMIGDSVPPKMMEAIASHIRKNILEAI